ncbi:MAG: tetratricopeptide repeat protein [Pseudomonadota bacterium]
MNELAGLSALIVEPHVGMRGSIHNMLNLCGLTKIDHGINAAMAIRNMKNRVYDLILCEYDLGEGQDGQQLLEDVRHHKIVPLSTVFFMVTAERGYAKVISAAELAPTDYILKPFTADNLSERINRALDKRTLFLPVYELMEIGNLHDAIQACIDGQISHRRFSIDFMRLRAELHVVLGQAAEAEAIYEDVFKTKAVAWARLGLVKTMFMQARFEEAKGMLNSLVAENSKFLDAYDWLAKTHLALEQIPEAQAVLEDAVAVSPHAVRRLRKLGEVAMEAGDMGAAEQALKQVVKKAKFSEFRDPEDHVRLVKTLIQQGNSTEAAAVIRDLEKSAISGKNTAACSAISSVMLHEHVGDQERLDKALTLALVACRDSVGLSNDTKMTLAKSCLQNDQDDAASEVMLEVMRNSPDNQSMAKAMRIFEEAGREGLAQQLAQDSRRQVVDLVAAGALKAKEGDYRGAVELMTQAVNKLPDNPQVVFNAAVAVLKCLDNLGWDSKLGEYGRHLIDSARRIDPANPRLAALSALHLQMLKKYGIQRNVR